MLQRSVLLHSAHLSSTACSVAFLYMVRNNPVIREEEDFM